MKFLKKIQDLPKETRKIIFWIIIVFIGVIFIVTWFYSIKTRLVKIEEINPFDQYKIPEIKMPEIKTPEIPDISEEEWNKMVEEEVQKESGSQQSAQ